MGCRPSSIWCQMVSLCVLGVSMCAADPDQTTSHFVHQVESRIRTKMSTTLLRWIIDNHQAILLKVDQTRGNEKNERLGIRDGQAMVRRGWKWWAFCWPPPFSRMVAFCLFHFILNSPEKSSKAEKNLEDKTEDNSSGISRPTLIGYRPISWPIRERVLCSCVLLSFLYQ